MTGLDVSHLSPTAANWKCYLCLRVSSRTRRSRRSVGGTGRNSSPQDSISRPSEWRDNRLGTRWPRHLDIITTSRGVPRSSNQYKPILANLPLATLSPQLQSGLGTPDESFGPSGERQNLIQKEQVLEILFQMDQQGTVPSPTMYRSLLKACARRKALQLAKRVHAHLAKHGLESHKSLGEYLVNMLVKCGGLEDALQLFHRLPVRTVFSWTAVISGYTSAGQNREALDVYNCMRGKGIHPDKYTFVSLLKACGSLFDLQEGKRIHAEVVKYRCESDFFVGTGLVDMYGKCGSIVDAQNVFDGLRKRDVVAWTVLLAAYVQQGQAEKALQLYEQIWKEGVSPDDRTFVSAIQACGILAEKEEYTAADGRLTKLKSLRRAKSLHADVQRRGYNSDVFICTTLVSIYGKCGSLVDAQDVFDKLSPRNVVSWNAMIGAYAQQGQAEKALYLYDQMQEEGVSHNDRTFVSAVQACAMLAEKEVDGQLIKVSSLEKGRAIHDDVRRKGYVSDGFVCNTLISMYGKCGSIVDAEDVFDGLPQPDVVSWNALLMAYVQQGEAQKALKLYRQMQEKGGSPDDRTFVSVLQACGMLAEEETDLADDQVIRFKSLEEGKAVHADAWKNGHDSDVFIRNTLVSMYGKCGSIVDAQRVFDGLSQHDVVSWNAMLAAYTQQGLAEQALQLYEQMQKGGGSPDNWTCVSMLQTCGMLAEIEVVVDAQRTKIKSLEKGKAIHAVAWRKGYDSDSFVRSSLVSMYGKCGDIVDAQSVFDGSFERDMASWNAMLAAYAQEGEATMALQLYVQLLEEGTSPDVRTFVSLLQSCSTLAEKEGNLLEEGAIKVKTLEIGKAIHANAHKKGYGSDLFVGSTLISLYGKCGAILDAQAVFDGMSHHSVVGWTAIISTYVDHGMGEKALQLYRQMQAEGVIPDDITLRFTLEACSNTGSLDACREIHHDIVSSEKGLTPLLATTLLHAYGTCASMVEAQDLFDALPQPDVVSWNALIAGYARQGNYAASLHCYEQMKLNSIVPDGVTFLSVISACSHGGLVDKGIEYFESMSRDFGLEPGVEHYVSMVDLLGRAGLFTRIQHLLSIMPVQPDLAMWLCLLGSCRKHRKVALAKGAFDQAVSLNPKHAAAYVLMSNIYADAGLLHCAKEVNAMEQAALAWKKPPGQSWIEHEKEVTTFVVGGKHPEHQQLRLLLRNLAEYITKPHCTTQVAQQH